MNGPMPGAMFSSGRTVKPVERLGTARVPTDDLGIQVLLGKILATLIRMERKLEKHK